ncbi:MAG: hypothetical protein OJJ21_02830 [Ferrovibrio sp.]|uniref:hypothetical protein n=1 Tax=Ferrovibrio sp. TaxID=1917215 RepID=UPI002609F069|nr:hypothetical protein [Ferrovibrio sp.]MCW0232513.1 hypothetical protein [Ferrovibrio sp.]
MPQNKKQVEIYTLQLSKEKLLNSPNVERNLFFLLGHLANDLLILNRLFLITAQSTHIRDDSFVKRFNTAQALLIGKIITSKLHEGWELTKKLYFIKEVSQKYDKVMPEPGKQALKALKRYFGKANIATSIRNEFGFHYPINRIDKTIKNINESEELLLYLSPASSNTLYYACDLIPNHEMIHSIGEENMQKSYDRLIDETAKCVKNFNDFIQNYMIAFIESNDVLEGDAGDRPTITYKSAPKLKHFKMPSVFDQRGM